MRAFVPRFPCQTSFSLHAGDWRPANVAQVVRSSYMPRISTPTDDSRARAHAHNKCMEWKESPAILGSRDDRSGWPTESARTFSLLRVKNLKTYAECWLPNLFPLLELEGMKTKHSQPKSKIDIQISKPWSSVNVGTNLRGSNCRVIHPDFCQSVAPSEDVHLQFLPWLLGWEGNSIADRTCKPSRSVALHCHRQIRGIPLGKWWHKWNHQCKKNSLSESCWGIACLPAPQM